jgi:hypothetical protein
LVHFFQFWYHAPRKIWQPWSSCEQSSFLLENKNYFNIYVCTVFALWPLLRRL